MDSSSKHRNGDAERWGVVQAYRHFIPVLTDISVISFAFFCAYCLRFDGWPGDPYETQFIRYLPFLIGARLLMHSLFGVYRFSWSFFGLREASRIAASVVIVTVFSLVFREWMWGVEALGVIPVGVLVVECLVSLAGMAGTRLQTRVLRQAYRRSRLGRRKTSLDKLGNLVDGMPHRTLLVGAGRAGVLAIREFRERPDLGYEVVGFVDDDRHKIGLVIEGIPVLGSTDEVQEIIERTHADSIVLTVPSASRGQLQELVTKLSPTGLSLQTVPPLYELLTGKLRISRVRPVSIEDLLGREEVPFDGPQWQKVIGAFGGKRIMVTGAGGSIGSELCRQLSRLHPACLLMVENHENNLFEIEQEMLRVASLRAEPCLVDVTSHSVMQRLFELHRPEIVFHAAAFKHVPLMEQHPEQAVLNNVGGTRVCAELAKRYGCERFVLVSTDKAVNPTNVMGATKRVAELLIQGLSKDEQTRTSSESSQSSTRYSCVRFGNVLGSRGSVLHTFQRQLDSGGPLTVTHPEITRSFMTIPEAVRLVIQAGAAGEGGDVFLLDMGQPMKIVDLARQMIRLSGFGEHEVGIRITGLRPGEKLYEELTLPEEISEPSSVDKVLRVRMANEPLEKIEGKDDVHALIDRLLFHASSNDAKQIRKELSQANIGFHSNAIPTEEDPKATELAAAESGAAHQVVA